MTFDIYAKLINEYGDLEEQTADRYKEELIALFESSPEGCPLTGIDGYGQWVEPFLHYAIGYEGITPPEMDQNSVRNILLGLFPRKVLTEPEEASNIVKELTAFWQFLGREFRLGNAQDCERATITLRRRLERALANPANFGMAKSIMWQGMQRGFDIGTEEGVNAWMETYNAEVTTGITEPVLPPGIVPSRSPDSSHSAKKKQKRKMQEASRKRNYQRKRKRR